MSTEKKDLTSEIITSTENLKTHELALKNKLLEAYERGATAEATKYLTDEFAKLRKTFDLYMKVLRNELGL